MKKEKNSNLHWHPAFVEAIKMELNPYLDKIEILPEFQLTTEPLKIDCIIIKKSKGLIIKKKFAEIFKDWNIIEYKSPRDYVSVNDFHKVYAYACLYSVLKNIPVNNITITFIESRNPKKLIDFLVNVRKYTVEKKAAGIYVIKGDVFLTQIIDNRRLSDSENRWLKNLRDNLNNNEAIKVAAEIDAVIDKNDINAYTDVILRANENTFKEAMEMGEPALKELVMETKVGRRWIAEWQAEAKTQGITQGITKGRAEGETNAILKIARNMKSRGMTNKLISQCTGLPLSKIKNLKVPQKIKKPVK
jgi:hypothetical protein